MKFAFVIFKYFPFGGAQRDMMRIARQCLALGHQVQIYTLSWQGDQPEAGISVEVIPGKGISNHRRYRYFIDQVQRRLAEGGFDLVVGFNRMPGLDAYFAADPCFEERAHTQRGWLYRLTGRYRFFAACERAVFSKESNCQALLVSPLEQPVFQRWYGTPDARFHLLPPVIPADRFDIADRTETRASVRAEFGFDANDALLLMVGSGFKTKGLDRALLALAALPEEWRCKTRLVAVGQDNPTPFLDMAKKLGLESQVCITAGRSDIPRLMQGADLLVHPAYRENTGLVLLEACASGLPVLVSDVCGYAWHIRESGAGLLAASPFSQNTFNAQVLQMLTSKESEQWGESGMQYAQNLARSTPTDTEAQLLVQFAETKAHRQ